MIHPAPHPGPGDHWTQLPAPVKVIAKYRFLSNPKAKTLAFTYGDELEITKVMGPFVVI